MDDLELASLRGRLESAAVELDFGARTGTGAVRVRAPRFSGLQGEALSADLEWRDDVVSLSTGVLQQARSRRALRAHFARARIDVTRPFWL